MTAPTSPAIRVFEPALCCNTGVCGPDVDQALVTFTAGLDHLRGLGVDIGRHNLANDPTAFATEPAVRDFLKVAGSAGLPLTLVHGVTVAPRSHPPPARLRPRAGRAGSTQSAPDSVSARVDLGPTAVTSGAAASSGGCCGGSGCC